MTERLAFACSASLQLDARLLSTSWSRCSTTTSKTCVHRGGVLWFLVCVRASPRVHRALELEAHTDTGGDAAARGDALNATAAGSRCHLETRAGAPPQLHVCATRLILWRSPVDGRRAVDVADLTTSLPLLGPAADTSAPSRFPLAVLWWSGMWRSVRQRIGWRADGRVALGVTGCIGAVRLALQPVTGSGAHFPAVARSIRCGGANSVSHPHALLIVRRTSMS